MQLPIKKEVFFNLKKSVYRDKELVKNKVILIHVPKVAGTAISKSLNIKKTAHTHLFNYEQEDRTKFQEFFKIGFVRNPWDRLVSAYFFLKSGGMKNKYDRYMENKLSSFNSFKDFVYLLDSDNQLKNEIINEIHFKPQYMYLINSKGEIEMDYIGYFENLEEGFTILKERLNKPYAELIKNNSSDHKPFWEYYDKNMIDIVGVIYDKDIELFKYKFPISNLS
jgi:chondroitin 4-sulfotransferase 11